MLFIHHTFERLSVKNCPAISSSARTGNELALNLAPTLNQAKVIKRNMNCDSSEKWQTPSETKKCEYGKSEAAECFVRYILKLFFCFCVNSTEKWEQLKKMGLHDTGWERVQLIPSIVGNLLSFKEGSSSWHAKWNRCLYWFITICSVASVFMGIQKELGHQIKWKINCEMGCLGWFSQILYIVDMGWLTLAYNMALFISKWTTLINKSFTQRKTKKVVGFGRTMSM